VSDRLTEAIIAIFTINDAFWLATLLVGY
jgi:hypothetical protein